MRTVCHKVAEFLFLTSLSSPIVAGQPEAAPATPDQVQKMLSASHLLQVPSIQRALKLTELQIEELGTPESQFENAVSAGDENAVEADDLQGLTSWQARRFTEIKYQIQGVRALASPELEKCLRLSERQRQQIAEVFTRHDRDAARIVSNDRPGGRAMPNQLESLHKATESAIAKILTPKQKSAWRKQLGKPFHLHIDLPELQEVPGLPDFEGIPMVDDGTSSTAENGTGN